MSKKPFVNWLIGNKTPVPFANARDKAFRLAEPNRNASESHMNAFSQSGTLFAIVDSLSTEVSQVEWKLYRKARPGQRPEDREEVTDHLALRVWNKPNPFLTRQEFIQSIEQHVDLVGESFWVVNSVEGFGQKFPTEMWPVRPDRMKMVKHPTEYLTGYMYCAPDGEEVPLNLNQVIMLRMPNPLDSYRGLGPVQSIMVDIDSARYGALWNRNFFINGAEPGGIIELEETLTDEEWDTLTTRWQEQHQGVANAHRVAFLEQGKFTERKFSQRDMQFVELRKASSEIIREAFRYPKAMLGTTEDVNKAVAEAAETHLARHLIVPRLERIKQALNNEFLALFGTTGQGVEFDYANPVPDDRQADNEKLTAAANAVKLLVESGVYGPDALTAVGLPPMAFGQPDQDVDPDRELLIKLVTGAPTLAPMILPMLGFDVPEQAPKEVAPSESEPEPVVQD